jgi:hypothetical protein
MSQEKPAGRAWHYYLLWIIALLSLFLNVAFVIGVLNFRAQARQQVQDASAFLDTVDIGDFDLPVNVDETLTLSMTVPFSDTFIVPISATVPVSTSVLFQDNIVVPINTIIPVNTTVNVPVNLPAVGLVSVPFPISTNIPVNLEVDVPISRTIPVETDIPVVLVVEVPVQSEVPIQSDIPVQLNFPVTIPLDEMGFQMLLQRVQNALNLLARLLGAG